VSAVRVNASVAIVMVGLPVREGLLVEGDLLGGRVGPGEPGEGSDGLGKYYR
jgi:hypothetical protein